MRILKACLLLIYSFLITANFQAATCPELSQTRYFKQEKLNTPQTPILFIMGINIIFGKINSAIKESNPQQQISLLKDLAQYLNEAHAHQSHPFDAPTKESLKQFRLSVESVQTLIKIGSIDVQTLSSKWQNLLKAKEVLFKKLHEWDSKGSKERFGIRAATRTS